VRPTPLVDALEERDYGGKAAKLARALRAGLQVPPGFALGVSHVEALFGGDGETLTRLREEFAQLGGTCAVRSSAIGEDSENASFAGQHLTVLNVVDDSQVADAVLKVRESAHTESARAYRRTMGLDDAPAIGVVVQRMIEADCAGVMFTKNPLNGADEYVIEAAWGLGEAVVAGLVVPDHYVLDAGGRVTERSIGMKDVAVRSGADGGTREDPVPDDLVNAACLSDTTLSELYGLAARCEEQFGRGLDIEWAIAGARLYLLQWRAMTRNR
jgi:pyruvate, water dikinase